MGRCISSLNGPYYRGLWERGTDTYGDSCGSHVGPDAPGYTAASGHSATGSDGHGVPHRNHGT